MPVIGCQSAYGIRSHYVMPTTAQALDLPAKFSFADFRRATPLDETSLWGVIFDRNAHRISVKRRDTALDNLQRIFAATFRLANDSGFQAMTLRDLCRETGMSMGGLYSYISSKELLSAMIEDVIRYLCEMLAEWFSAIPDPLDRVEAVLRGHLCLSEMLQPWFFFMYLETRTLPPEQRRESMASELGIEKHIADTLAAQGSLSSSESQLLASHALAMVQDWHLKRWKYSAAGVNVDTFADSVVAVVRARVAVRG